MSRRSDRRAVTARCLALVGLVTLLVGVPAHASGIDTRSAGEEERQSIRITAPEEMGEAVSFPTVDLREGGIELTSVSEDLEGAAQLAEASDTIDVILNGNVLFGKDSAVILPAADERLQEVIAVLQERGPGSLRIIGYTDDLGSAAHGLVLSRQRAQAVRAVLEPALEGIEISSEGRGEAEPRVPNNDEKSRALNRRVEIHFERASAD